MGKSYKSVIENQFKAFNNMLEEITVYKLIFDDEGEVIGGIVEYMNPVTVETIDMNPEDVTGKNAMDLFGSDVLKPYIEAINEFFVKGEFKRFEIYYPPTDRYFIVSGFYMQDNLFAILRTDITDRKKAEMKNMELLEELQDTTEELQVANEELQDTAEELQVANEELRQQGDELMQVNQSLRESELRLSRSQEIAHIGSWELDLVNNQLYWSDEVYRIFGLKPQEFGATYEAFLESIHPDDLKAVDDAYKGSLRDGRDSYEIEHRVVRKLTGEIRIVHEKCEHFRDESGQIIRSMGMVHDITERKKAEQDLKEAHDNLELKVEERTVEIEEAYQIVKENEIKLKEAITELKRSNEELQSFAYITSHDLQEPLRSVASYSQLIQRRYDGQLDSDADEFLEYMVSGATRMKSMIQGLLDYSRINRAGTGFVKTDMNVKVEKAVSNLKYAIDESNAEVTHDNLPNVFADPDQMVRVFQNLIGNAIKFKKADEPPKIHISAGTVKESNEWVFLVSDNGIGMEPQYTHKIFEVFKRLHPIGEYQGAGIGLAVVKRIIDRHGGRVWVESVFGVGSTFYFTIPFNPKEIGGEGNDS